jgi:hypothetical protein
MFADDLLLLAISITHLQCMIDMCSQVLGSCYLQLNSKKSFLLRVGPRHNFTDAKLTLNGQVIAWKSEIRYLGVFIVSAKNFKCNLQTNRQKFFIATNGIFGKIGTRAPLSLLLSLIDTFCIPVLLYGLEAMSLSKSDKNTLEFAYSTVFYKLFQVKEKENINLCQYYSGCLPVSCRLDLRKLNFLRGLHDMQDSLPCQLSKLTASDEYCTLMNFYDILPCDHSYSFWLKVVRWLETNLNIGGGA